MDRPSKSNGGLPSADKSQHIYSCWAGLCTSSFRALIDAHLLSDCILAGVFLKQSPSPFSPSPFLLTVLSLKSPDPKLILLAFSLVFISFPLYIYPTKLKYYPFFAFSCIHCHQILLDLSLATLTPSPTISGASQAHPVSQHVLMSNFVYNSKTAAVPVCLWWGESDN